jgi:polyisoprenoid-binding protein YceI
MQLVAFRGELHGFSATLVVAGGRLALAGSAPVAGISTPSIQITRNLLGPAFFDSAHHPVLRVDCPDARLDGTAVEGTAALTIKSVTHPVVLRGTLAGPSVDLFGASRLGLELETVLDRTLWGIDWNVRLPGGGLVLAEEVTLNAQLELVRDAKHATV